MHQCLTAADVLIGFLRHVLLVRGPPGHVLQGARSSVLCKSYGSLKL